MSISANNSVIKNALLYVLMRWTDRLIGFISTLVLARLLVPDDYGIIAMTSLVIGLVDVLLDLGVNIALIQNREPTQAHYNTAFTLRLLQAGTTALIVCIIAPFAAHYFSDPRVAPVLQVMAISVLIAGFENIGIITFQKEMRADLDFRFTFSKRIIGLVATITAAWLLHSYWALVIGTFFGRTFGVFLSYRFHSMRPRFSLEKIREIFAVSQWMLINSVGTYINSNLHKLLVGRQGAAATMGGYALADDISAMPSTEILSPLNRVLFPAFVRARHDLLELKRIFLLAQGVQCLIALPASIGLAFIARDAVLVLLGAKWLLAVPFVQVLAISNVIQAITTSSGYVLLALGRNRSATLTTWTQLTFFSIIAVFVFKSPSAVDFAWLRVASVFAGLSIAIWMLMRSLPNVGLFEIAKTTIRPVLATAMMGLAILTLRLEGMSPGVVMLLKIVIGILSYVVAILTMWSALGRPPGAEAYLLEKIKGAFNRPM